MPGRLSGKVCVITGTGGSIGRAASPRPRTVRRLQRDWNRLETVLQIVEIVLTERLLKE